MPDAEGNPFLYLLEALMTLAYNQKLKGTPFEVSHRLELPDRPEVPFKGDLTTIERMKGRFCSTP